VSSKHHSNFHECKEKFRADSGISGYAETMTGKHYSVATDSMIENVGSDLLVFAPGSTDVIRLTDDAVKTLRALQAGIPVAPSATVDSLIRWGIVTDSGFSRRGLIKASSVGAVAGIAVLAMPSVAAASSGIPVDGAWFVFGNTPTVYFLVAGYDFPNVGDSDGTPPGDTEPTELLVDGEEFSVDSWKSSQGAEEDGDNVVWTATENDTDKPWLVIATQAPTITATFTWNGQPYVGTFAYEPPTPP
jgi:hypothetical protein